MLTNDELFAKAVSYLQEINLQTGRDFNVYKSTFFDEAILIQYQTSKFIDSGDIRFAILGHTVFIVSRKDGTVFYDPCLRYNNKEYLEYFLQNVY